LASPKSFLRTVPDAVSRSRNRVLSSRDAHGLKPQRDEAVGVSHDGPGETVEARPARTEIIAPRGQSEECQLGRNPIRECRRADLDHAGRPESSPSRGRELMIAEDRPRRRRGFRGSGSFRSTTRSRPLVCGTPGTRRLMKDPGITRPAGFRWTPSAGDWSYGWGDRIFLHLEVSPGSRRPENRWNRRSMTFAFQHVRPGPGVAYATVLCSSPVRRLRKRDRQLATNGLPPRLAAR